MIVELRGAGVFAMGEVRMRGLTQGHKLTMERQPANPVDTNAIVVSAMFGKTSCPICYVAREVAQWLAPALSDDWSLVYIEPGSYGTWKPERVRTTARADGFASLRVRVGGNILGGVEMEEYVQAIKQLQWEQTK